jgi:pyruvate formate lyase activating enzyme
MCFIQPFHHINGKTLTESQGIVFDVKHFAVHDGPRIRTTIFLKGCPLRCEWCHSPESQNPIPELLIHQDRCIGCRRCLEVCKLGAISSPGAIDRSKCNLCGECTETCYAEALELLGKKMTIDQLMEIVEKDKELLISSGGGVTLSGGEPMMHSGFAVELLRRLKETGYHTALDTSGYTTWEKLKQALEYSDLVLYDLKHMDSLKHKQHTGVSNDLILENLRKTSKNGNSIWIRVPLIPRINDDEENLRELADYVKGLEVERTYILPYHTLGVAKYAALDREYELKIEPHSFEKLKEIKELVRGLFENVVMMGVE